MAVVDVADSQSKLVDLVWGLAATWRSVCIHQMNSLTLTMTVIMMAVP